MAQRTKKSMLGKSANAQAGSGSSADDDMPGSGAKLVFWAWLGVIAVGLAVMITIPLIGR